MNKTIIGFVAAIIVLGGLIWTARPDAKNASLLPTSESGNNGTLTVEEANNYDFGTISMAAGKVKYTFKIKNTSSEAINIERIYTSCMCTTATLTIGDKQFGPYGMPGHGAIPRINQAVNPNEEAAVEVVFDPAAHGPAGVGRIQRVVTLEDSAGRLVELQFAAIVTP